MILRSERTEAFTLSGVVQALGLEALEKGGGGARPPSRPMGGWLMTYGKIGPDGGVVPTVDRDGHTVDAARQLGDIDWSEYIKGGAWNDTHDEGVIVGLPDSLEFHDGTTPLSKAHGKVGFWTTGHLVDRADPLSWEGLTDAAGRPRTPTAQEFARADHFWSLAGLLKGDARPLGLSAHGLMALSPCRSRITFAKVRQAAVCELPKNPDATLEPLELAMGGRSPLHFLRKGMVGRDPCRTCTCPPGACEGLLRKAGVHAGNTSAVVPQDLEGVARHELDDEAKFDLAVELLMERHHVDRARAERWLRQYVTTHRQGAHREDSKATAHGA